MLVLFSIALPTADVYTDLRLILFLYFLAPDKYLKADGEECGGVEAENLMWFQECSPSGWKSHTTWATLLLVPFLTNYLLSWLAWARFETYKKESWRLPALNLYPQYRAARVVKLFWNDPTRGAVEKQEFLREISLSEVFTEAIPTMIITGTIVSVETQHKASPERVSILGPPDSPQEYLFFASGIISGLSASFGIANCLKVGVCKIMMDGESLLSGRFLLVLLSAFLSLGMKTCMIVAVAAPGSQLVNISKYLLLCCI